LFLEFSVFERLPDKMINSLEKMKAEKEFIHGFVAEIAGQKIVGYASYFVTTQTLQGHVHRKPRKRQRSLQNRL
jgi:heme A synthase